MIIGIDLRCLPADGTAGAGVAHAARFLTQALLDSDVPWEWRLYLPEGSSWTGEGDIVPLQKTHGRALFEALRHQPCDVLFVPGGSIAPRLPVVSLPWVHDLAIFDHPEWFPQSFFRRLVTTALFRRGVKRAPIIFAVSETTKRELITRFGLDPSRVIVTLEGGDPFLVPGKERKPFVLALGTIEPRKNLSMLLRAWQLAEPRLPSGVDLVIAGRPGWKNEDLLQRIARSPRVRHLADVDDEKRRELLQSAALVVVPSLYEGFGLVALEAMQAGAPLLASNAGALPEVVAEGGKLLDPWGVDIWADTLVELMENDYRREQMSKAAVDRALHFSWAKSAKIVVEALKTKTPRLGAS